MDETATLRLTELGWIGHFELLDHVGRGHFGDVFKARDTELDRIVAVKVPRTQGLDAGTKKLFLREARAAARLRHPHIVAVYEVGGNDDTIYIVSEFIDGVTLADLARQDKLPLRRALELCIKVGHALQHAHQEGVVHRDLKPQNILIDSSGDPHVADFGLAKRDAVDITMTFDGVVLGTPAYMPPEQARGDAHLADARSDVYSLGVVLYELLTGRRPFLGSGKRLLLYQIQNDDPPALRKFDKRIPRDLETICLKALSKPPGRRYETVGAMVEDLQRFLEGRPIRARRASRVERAWRWTRRNPALASSLAAVGVLILLVTGWLGGRTREYFASHRLVRLDTSPSGASVVFMPLDATTGSPRTDRCIGPRKSPVSLRLLPGDYFVVAFLNDSQFHEVYRHVPDRDENLPAAPFRHRRWRLEGSTVLLDAVELPPSTVAEGMALVGGAASFEMGSSHLGQLAPPHKRSVPAFYLDTSEVTYRQYPELRESADVAGNCLPQELADDHAVVCVTFDQALAYAESIGKRLPTEAEYEFAATGGGTRKLPWDEDIAAATEWPFGPVGANRWDRVDLDAVHPIFGLYSNVAEWTQSRFQVYPGSAGAAVRVPEHFRQSRVVRGGPFSVVNGKPDRNEWSKGPCDRLGAPESLRKPGLGFRCARSVRPRLKPEDFERLLPEAPVP